MTGVTAFPLLACTQVLWGLGWTAGLPTAIVTSGAALAMLGIFVAVRFLEDNFTHVRRHRWATTTLSRSP
jgi:hypothetical protein